MRISRMLVVAPVLVFAAACSTKGDSSVDDALKNDLALAASQQPYQPQQYMSPMEQGYYGQAPMAQQYAPMGYAPQPVYAPAPARVVYRSAPAARSTSSGTASETSTARAPQRVVKHTGRDAAIGAAAGAIIGATTSRDKLKGGVIGAAAGGILGAVIGNNVDVKRYP